MIDGLESLLMNRHRAGVAELQATLQEMLGKNASGRLVEEKMLLRSRVYRLKFEIKGSVRSFVVKRLTPSLAQLEKTVIERWLPRVSLSEHGAPLIGAAAERSGECIWHIYDDIGDSSLIHYTHDDAILREAVALIAEVHMRFAGHILLGECRMFGGNYGISNFSKCVWEAMHTLELVKCSGKDMQPSRKTVVERLLHRLSELYDTRHDREQIMMKYYGMETMLHGDLWINNFLVHQTNGNRRMLLIDWDHVGVGPVHYDLSTLLMRVEPSNRLKMLDWYRESVAAVNFQLPDIDALNMLFETAEYARLAHSLIWPAITAGDTQEDWAFEDLIKMDRWFDDVRPVLPDATSRKVQTTV